eukprot:TRINITY_DN89922_c0_g1_i1.p1 TRINITY_DN89922_c0_g1~~TRINITY_DN89922_c0_g1_i1.p1  ORF type:complete len:888 (+),score=156.53 TRINITY_DN89922_c0_g1_i1:103-2766(+)
MTATEAARLAWPAVGMEAAAAALMQEAPKAQKLDAAMSVLTSLLMDLENELKAGDSQPPCLGNKAPGLPVTPLAHQQPATDAGLNGVLDRTDKLDSALNVLTRQLAQLEEELRGGAQDTTPPPRVAPSNTSSRRKASPTGAAAERVGAEVILASPEARATAPAVASSPSPPMKTRAAKAPATGSELDENRFQAQLATGKQTPGSRFGVAGSVSARREPSRGGGTTPTVPRPAVACGALGGQPTKVQPPAPPSHQSQASRRSLLQQHSSQEQPSNPRLQQSQSPQPPLQLAQMQSVQPLQPAQALQHQEQQQPSTGRASPQHGKASATTVRDHLAATDTTQAVNSAANSLVGRPDGAVPFAIPLNRERSASPVTQTHPCQGLSKTQPPNRNSASEAAAYPLTRSQTPCVPGPGKASAATLRPGGMPCAVAAGMPSAVAPVAMASVAQPPGAARPPQGGQSPIRCLSPSACPGYSQQQAAPSRLTSAPQHAQTARRNSQSPIRWNNQAPENMYSNSQVARTASIDNTLMQIGRPHSGEGPFLDGSNSPDARAPSQPQLVSAAAMAAAAVSATAGMGPPGGLGPVLPLGGRPLQPGSGGAGCGTPVAGQPLSGPPGPSRNSNQRSPSASHPKLSLSRSDMTHSPFARRGADGGHASPALPPGQQTFNICRSSTSLTSSNPSFYMPAHQSAGGSPMNTGPVPAVSYTVDLSDQVDQMLGTALRMLDVGAARKLMLQRLALGRYEIDGRKVTLRWSQHPGVGLVAIEDEVQDSHDSEMPLLAYLSQAGNVAASLSGQRADMPKISRVPKERRLTFRDDEKGHKNLAQHIDKIGNERCESMRLAVEQARLREEAAEAYESGLRFPRAGSVQARSLPPPPGLPYYQMNLLGPNG